MPGAGVPGAIIQVRLFYSHITEPTNKIAPRSDKSRKFEGGEIFLAAEAEPVYLTCEVAGYPAPIYR